MNQAESPLLALQNAWAGAVEASEAVRALAPAVAGLDPATPLASLDLEAYRRAVLAQSNAVMALRGLIEQLERKRAQA